MTYREKQILDIIKNNPMISQQEIANILDITRSSIAVHIANLIKKGYIKGKGYVVNEGNYVTVIGGANIDIQGVPNSKLNMFDSNPGKIDISLGGVGRNIAENIARLGISTKFISAIGNDLYGEKIISESKLSGINMDDCYIVDNHSTSVYLSILNENKDMQLALSHMDILDKLDTTYIHSKSNTIKDSLAIVLDTNLKQEVIDYIVNTFKGCTFFLDTVSTKKALKIKDILGKFNTIKLNKYEAETLSDIAINKEDDLKRCSSFFLEKGVKKVFITLGKDGVFCADENNLLNLKGLDIKVVNATGAGDAFTSGLIYSYLNNFDLEQSAKFSTGASLLALSHKNTINPNMSVENIEKLLKEMILC